ncbi:hypothetical protein SAMN05216289_12413 [Dokdonella immobilis]|uniref:Uncharacterized protein n=1 Tax=Dokdonella immobilis TaxID=578942 RepID=A0A1I4ZA43_9GAMM|nr:hypothetical protein SAMN05216289_12413 [Dokdonella immobilis]
MPRSKLFWINQLSFLGTLGILSALTSSVSGDFFASILSSKTPADELFFLRFAGLIFGFSVQMVLLVCGVLIPGELFGFMRPYRAGSPEMQKEREMYRTVLLSVGMVMAWGALGSFAVVLRTIASSQ